MTTRTFKFKDEVAEATMLMVDLDPQLEPMIFIKSSVNYRGLPASHPLMKWMAGNIEEMHASFDGREALVSSACPDEFERFTISG